MKPSSKQLPGDHNLSQNEKIFNTEKFASSLLTFYIKGSMISTNKRLIYHYPNIVLCLIPMGFESETFNLKKISSVNLSIEYKILRIITGITLGILLIWAGIGLIFLIWGLLGIKTNIIISTSGGETKWPVIFWEKQKARNFISQINLQLAELDEKDQ